MATKPNLITLSVSNHQKTLYLTIGANRLTKDPYLTYEDLEFYPLNPTIIHVLTFLGQGSVIVVIADLIAQTIKMYKNSSNVLYIFIQVNVTFMIEHFWHLCIRTVSDDISKQFSSALAVRILSQTPHRNDYTWFWDQNPGSPSLHGYGKRMSTPMFL